MKRLYLTVEGQTEAAFATSVLTPHLAQFNVRIVRAQGGQHVLELIDDVRPVGVRQSRC